jgi:hypothetical protein
MSESVSINHIFLHLIFRHYLCIHALDDLVDQGLDRLHSFGCSISVAGYYYYFYSRRRGHVLVRCCFCFNYCNSSQKEGSLDFLARLGRQSQRLGVVATSIAANATPLGRY